MTKKCLAAFGIILSLAVIALSVILFTGCDKQKTSWTIAADGGEISAYFSDNGRYGYVLNVEGEGKLPDYASKKDAPWYYRSGRITDIKISEGITAIGSNAFTDIKAKTVVVPKTALSIGENSFYAETMVCTYSLITAPEGLKQYLYSETAPETEGEFWHFKGETASLWVTTKILFIGNSFTYYSDIPELFRQVATAAGDSVVVDSVTQGAWTLTKFADEKDEYGKIVDEKLKASNDYDAVVLQEQSTRPLDNYSAFLSAAKALQTKIKATQTDCRIYLYSTWGYADEAATRKMTIPEMEAKLRTAYENAASAMKVNVSYVGKAFTEVYNAHKEVNDECFANPDKFADSAEKGFYLYFKDDNKHPSYSGAFLSACVHVATILDTDPRLSTFTGELDAATASALKEAAYNAVHK